MKIDREYPRPVKTDAGNVTVRLMNEKDREGVLRLTRSMPEHDRLFLHRDATREEVVDEWIAELASGESATLLAERSGTLVGCATVQSERDAWSAHVAELRVLVGPGERGRGLGRALTQEVFAAALSAGIEKLMVRMTPDQKAALRTFQGLGFRPEALLQEHVKDQSGRKHDLLILAHDVAAFQTLLDAYGVTEALGE